MTVRHNAAAHRYEMDSDSGLAIAVYREQGDRMIFTHTEVPPADEDAAARLNGREFAFHGVDQDLENASPKSGLPTSERNSRDDRNVDHSEIERSQGD